MRLPILALLTMLAASVACAKSPTPAGSAPQVSQDFDPALRQPWSRGSQRFQRQWLFAAPVAREAITRLVTVSVVPAPGQPVASDIPDVRWVPFSNWSDTIDLDEVEQRAVGDGEATVAYASLPQKQSRDANLLLGVDGVVDVWLNGERVFSRSTATRFVPDSDRIPIRLQQGDNRLYLRLQAPATGPWRFALRVVAPGAVLAPYGELAPEIVDDHGDRLTIQPHVALEGSSAAIEFEVMSAAGHVVESLTADRGNPVTFASGAWKDGAYDIRLTTRDAWGNRKVAHVPWYKGDTAVAVSALQKDAAAAGNDPEGATLRMLGSMADYRMKQPRRVAADLWSRLQSPLMEYEELKLGSPVYAGGFVRLGYVDEVDGSVQFCRAYLPFDYEPSRRWPLVMFLHGYNPSNPDYYAWWSADQRHSVIADEHGTIYVEAHGRGNAQYQGIGERDVLRCLDEAAKRFAVDEDRVYLTGESMGGHGTWSVASHYPQRFAAVAPVFGGWDFRVTPPPGAPSQNWQPTNARQAFVQEQMSSFSGVENLLNVPLLVTHGDADASVSVEGSRHATRMLQRWNYDIRYHEVPGFGHEDLVEREHIVEWLLGHRRNASPRQVRVRSTSLDSARANWLSVLEFEEPLRVIRAEAEVIRPGTVRVDSDNAAVLSLSLPAELRGNGDVVTVVWNGKSQEVKPVSGVIELRKPAAVASGLRKHPELAGALSDVIRTPFAIVVGTISRDPQMREFCAQKAAAMAALWRRWQHQPLRTFKDAEISRADQERYSLILIGGADSNAVTRTLAAKLPFKVAIDSVTVDQHRIATTDAVLQLIYPHPLNAERYVMVVAATSAHGMYFWTPSLVHPQLGFSLLQADWRVQDGRRMPANESIAPDDAYVASGVFDARWRLQDRWTFEANRQRRDRWPLRHAPQAGRKVPATALQANAGRYELLPGFTVTVVNTADSLTLQIPGVPPMALIAESETSFSDALTGGAVEFVRDPQGLVTSMEMDNVGTIMVARRLQ